MVLDVPTDKPNTNMLIVDSPDETNLVQMMPIGLPESKAGVYVRAELNLYNKLTFYTNVSAYMISPKPISVV